MRNIPLQDLVQHVKLLLPTWCVFSIAKFDYTYGFAFVKGPERAGCGFYVLVIQYGIFAPVVTCVLMNFCRDIIFIPLKLDCMEMTRSFVGVSCNRVAFTSQVMVLTDLV